MSTCGINAWISAPFVGSSGRQWAPSVRAPGAPPKRGCSAGGLQLWLWGCRSAMDVESLEI